MPEVTNLWYKRPNSSDYELVHQALDDLFHRLAELELDEDDLKVGLTD
jgi:hypothetical protein